MPKSQMELPAEANVGEPWIDKFGRVRQPAVMHEADDGTVTYGREALAVIASEAGESLVRANRRTPVVRVPRRTNGPSGRPKPQSSRSSAASGDSGDDPPPAAPRVRASRPGLENLLITLSRGLDADALPVAAALVVALDKSAR
jgi:hypothetical protein